MRGQLSKFETAKLVASTFLSFWPKKDFNVVNAVN